jgi:hypothetical protein
VHCRQVTRGGALLDAGAARVGLGQLVKGEALVQPRRADVGDGAEDVVGLARITGG